MKTCPYCESEIANNAKTCKYCGESVVEEKNVKTCPYCKSEIPIDALKCRYCRKWIENKDKIKILKEEPKKYNKKEPLHKKIFLKKYNEVFYNDNNEIFIRDNIPSKESYYWKRIGILVLIIFIGLSQGTLVIPGLILLYPLFGLKKPWNDLILINENGIGKYEEGRSKDYEFYTRDNVVSINFIDANKGIILFKKGIYADTEGFSFYNIDNYDILKQKIKKYK